MGWNSKEICRFERICGRLENAGAGDAGKPPQFLNALAGAIEIGGFFFAHAGVNPKKPLSAQEFDDLAFIREPFLSWNKPLAKMIVHGHSIVPEPEILPHRIGIDTGVYQPDGKLSAGVFEGNTVRFLQVEPR